VQLVEQYVLVLDLHRRSPEIEDKPLVAIHDIHLHAFKSFGLYSLSI